MTRMSAGESTLAESQLQVLLAEHQRVRDEILHHKSTQQTIVNFVILLVAAEIALFSQVVEKGFDARYTTVLLLLPVPFALLAIYHSAYTARVHKLAEYIDGELRDKIERIVGERTLRTKSYYATRNILDLRHARPDGKATYLALMGLKSLPQIVPLAVCVSLGVGDLSWWQWAWFGGDVGLVLISSLGQHD